VDPDALARLRQDYDAPPLTESDLAPEWDVQFARWLDEAAEFGLAEPNAMILATAAGDGRPGARTVLLRSFDATGFVFNTNRRSRKGREIESNPRAALVFPWFAMQRQVVVDGVVESLSGEESDASFALRPAGARRSAVASPQSEVIPSRAWLEQARDAVPEDAPRPEHWGGLRVVPDAVEFWHGRRDRLHDRLRYRREDTAWVIERLGP